MILIMTRKWGDKIHDTNNSVTIDMIILITITIVNQFSNMTDTKQISNKNGHNLKRDREKLSIRRASHRARGLHAVSKPDNRPSFVADRILRLYIYFFSFFLQIFILMISGDARDHRKGK